SPARRSSRPRCSGPHRRSAGRAAGRSSRAGASRRSPGSRPPAPRADLILLQMESGVLQLQPAPELVRRARLLARLGVAWHAVEAVVALAAGIAAGSIALVGFGADSIVEGAAGLVLMWRLGAARAGSEAAERRAQRLIGASFFAIAAYVSIEAARTLIAANHPDSSWVW